VLNIDMIDGGLFLALAAPSYPENWFGLVYAFYEVSF